MKSLNKHIHTAIKFLMCALILTALIINPTIKTLNTLSKSYLEFADFDIEEHTDTEEKQEERKLKNKEFKILNTLYISLHQRDYTNKLDIYKEKEFTYFYSDIIIPPPDFKG